MNKVNPLGYTLSVFNKKTLLSKLLHYFFMNNNQSHLYFMYMYVHMICYNIQRYWLVGRSWRSLTNCDCLDWNLFVFTEICFKKYSSYLLLLALSGWCLMNCSPGLHLLIPLFPRLPVIFSGLHFGTSS